MGVNITTWPSDWAKALTANSTSASFAALAPTATKPTGSGVLDQTELAAGHGGAPNNLQFAFYGTDAADKTFSVRLTGWCEYGGLWVPVPIAEFSATLGTATGVEGASVTNAEYFADTITKTAGDSSIILNSLADNRIASVLVDTFGYKLVQVTFDMTGAVAGNALYRWM